MLIFSKKKLHSYHLSLKFQLALGLIPWFKKRERISKAAEALLVHNPQF